MAEEIRIPRRALAFPEGLAHAAPQGASDLLQIKLQQLQSLLWLCGRPMSDEDSARHLHPMLGLALELTRDTTALLKVVRERGPVAAPAATPARD